MKQMKTANAVRKKAAHLELRAVLFLCRSSLSAAVMEYVYLRGD